MNNLLVYVIAYFIGCLSPSYIFSKIFRHIDIRDYGSGNAGTTNVIRVNGIKLGLLVFIVDFCKGALTACFTQKYFGTMTALIVSVLVIMGHIYPVFLGFRGGKGVACSLGVFFCLFFREMSICAAIGLILLYIMRYVSLSSMVTLFSVNVLLIIEKTDPRYIACTFFIFALVTYNHRSNIKRLRNHEENKFSLKSKKQ